MISESLFSVFPNPIITEFNIELNKNIDGKIHVFITDVQGKIVQDFGKNSLENTKQNMNFKLQNINPGVYTIHINSGGTNSSKRVIIK